MYDMIYTLWLSTAAYKTQTAFEEFSLLVFSFLSLARSTEQRVGGGWHIIPHLSVSLGFP